MGKTLQKQNCPSKLAGSLENKNVHASVTEKSRLIHRYVTNASSPAQPVDPYMAQTL
jgi:hypothetical protein